MALNYIDRNNLPVMTAACWSLGYAHHLRGETEKSREAYHRCFEAMREMPQRPAPQVHVAMVMAACHAFTFGPPPAAVHVRWCGP